MFGVFAMRVAVAAELRAQVVDGDEQDVGTGRLCRRRAGGAANGEEARRQ